MALKRAATVALGELAGHNEELAKAVAVSGVLPVTVLVRAPRHRLPLSLSPVFPSFVVMIIMMTITAHACMGAWVRAMLAAAEARGREAAARGTGDDHRGRQELGGTGSGCTGSR